MSEQFQAVLVRETGAPEVLKLEKVDVPELQASQVLVKIHAAGVNPIETYFRAGTYQSASLPYRPGTDGAGVVEKVGSGVTKFKVGDRVWTAGAVTGTYAEKAVVDESTLWPLPEKASFEQGAALNIPYGTAYQALFTRGRGKKGETLFVHGGTGGVGIAAIQFAKAAGLTIIATGGTEEGRKLLIANGASHALDHRSEGYLAKVTELTEGKGPDLIIEMLANVNLQNDLRILGKYGRIVIVGSRGPIEITPREAMGRNADILGMALYNTPDEDRRRGNQAIVDGLKDGSLNPIIGSKYSLQDAPKAHHEVIAHETGSHGKIVLVA